MIASLVMNWKGWRERETVIGKCLMPWKSWRQREVLQCCYNHGKAGERDIDCTVGNTLERLERETMITMLLIPWKGWRETQ